MRVFGKEAERRVHGIETARNWRRAGLIDEAQLLALETDVGPLPARAGFAIRGLFFFFGVVAAVALVAVVGLLWTAKVSGAFAIGCSLPCYLLAERTIRSHRLYRFGVEEGIACLAVAFLSGGIAALLEGRSVAPSLVAWLVGLPAVVGLGWLYLRMGYLYALFAALAALTGVLSVNLRSLPSPESRALLAVLWAGLLGLSTFRRAVPDHDRRGWSVFQASLFGGVCLLLNQRLHVLLDLDAKPEPPGGVLFYGTFVAILVLPVTAVRWAVLRKQKAFLVVGFLALVVALSSVKPYFGLARNPWDPAILGAALVGLALFLRRYLEAGDEGRRHGWTARALRAARPEEQAPAALLTQLAAASVATPGVRAPAAERDPFSGQGGSSGGGGASGTF